MWQIRNQATNQNQSLLEINIYDTIEGDSYDWWTGEVIESETSAKHFMKLLDEHKDVENINIYINSCGGSVYEGNAIYAQLKRHPAYKTVYIDGFACSIASVIAMAGDKIIMSENACMMIHRASSYAWGNAVELRKAADDLEVIDKAIMQAYVSKVNGKLSEEEITEKMYAETYLDAKSCVEFGLADEIASNAVVDEAQKAFAAYKQHQMLTASKSSVLDIKNKAPVPEPKAPEPEPELSEQAKDNADKTEEFINEFMKFFKKGE